MAEIGPRFLIFLGSTLMAWTYSISSIDLKCKQKSQRLNILLDKKTGKLRSTVKADKRMEFIARELALKCSGMPFVAWMVGLLLDSTRAEKWEDVLDNDTWLQQDIIWGLFSMLMKL